MGHYLDILAADAAGRKAEADAAFRALHGPDAEQAHRHLQEALRAFEQQHGQHLGHAKPMHEAVAKARLHAAAPDLLVELLAAHRLLALALGVMTPASRFKFATASEREGLGVDGATRHAERAAVIARATGVKS